MPPVRDIRDLNYREIIKDFMKKVRSTDYVILIISPDYLKFVNCMYEIGELIKDESYKKRILLLIKNGTDIFTSIGQNSYIIYWQEEYEKLYDDSKKLELISSSERINDLIRYERIKRDLPGFLKDISDTNSITCDAHINDTDFKKMMSIIKG